MDNSKKPIHRSFQLTPDSELAVSSSPGSLRKALAFAVVQVVPLLTVGALLLDRGVVFRHLIVATLGFWCFALLVCVRHQANPSRLNIYLVKYGFWGWFLLVCLIANLLQIIERVVLVGAGCVAG